MELLIWTPVTYQGNSLFICNSPCIPNGILPILGPAQQVLRGAFMFASGLFLKELELGPHCSPFVAIFLDLCILPLGNLPRGSTAGGVAHLGRVFAKHSRTLSSSLGTI